MTQPTQMNQTTAPAETDNLLALEKPDYLTPARCVFTRQGEDFLSCTIDGKAHETVTVIRNLPYSAPEEFLSVLEEENELGMIRQLTDFDPDTAALLRAQLKFRYFTPQITKVKSAQENVSFLFLKLETTSGDREICINDVAKNIVTADEDRVYITDVEENRYCIPSLAALDTASRSKIEIYL